MADVTRSMEIDLTAKDNTKAGTDSAKANLKGLAMEAGAVALALGALVTKQGLDAWAKQEQAIIQQENRLKTTGAAAWTTSKQLQDLAASLQSVTIFGDDTITEMQNLLLTFTSIKGPEFEGAQRAILDLAAAMAQGSGGEIDLKSAAIQVGKALNDPAQGISALQRVGVSFTEAQKEVIKSLQETGHVAEAQRLIIAELTKEFGGAATATGLSGAMVQAKNYLGEMSEEFGRGVSEGSALTKTLGVLTAGMRDKDNLAGIYAMGTAIGTLADWYIKLNQAVGIAAAKVATGFAPANADWAGVNNANTAVPSGVIKAVLEPAAATFGGALAEVAAAELAKTPRPPAQMTLGRVGEMGMPGRPTVVPELGGLGGKTSFPMFEEGITGHTAGAAAPDMGPIWMAATGSLADLEQYLMSEEELLTNAALRWQQMANDARDQGIISEQQATDLKLQIWDEERAGQEGLIQKRIESEQAASARAIAISDRETAKKKQNAANEVRDRQQKMDLIQNLTNNVFGALSAGLDLSNEKDFKKNQDYNTANAIINTAMGATKAYGQYGWPWGAVAAAAVIAAGMAQVQQIRSQKYKGGGGGVSASSGAIVPIDTTSTGVNQALQPSPIFTDAQRSVSYNITVLGNIVDQDAFARDLIIPLERARLDGVTA